jgi:hypothetical protein
MPSAFARPVRSGWVVRDRVPGPDVDEFAEPTEVIAALANTTGDTLLAVQHPHRTPDAIAAGRSLADTLPGARAMLDRLLRKDYRPVADVVAPYRVTGPDGDVVGVLCMIDPHAVDTDGTAKLRPAEQVYPKVAAERSSVLTGLGVASSAAMLVPVEAGDALTDTVTCAVDRLGPAEVSDTDSAGRIHRMWLVGPGPAQDELLAACRAHPLMVADGNHRVAAALAAPPTGLLALVTAGPDLRIGAFHRTLVGTGLSVDALASAWRRVGLAVHETPDTPPPRPGVVVAETAGGVLTVGLREPEPGEPLPRIDHGVVERLLIATALGIDPAGPHVRALPDSHPVGSEVDVVLRIAAVRVADVRAVHRQGRRMPRKSTYFTPKPRSGLLLAELLN